MSFTAALALQYAAICAALGMVMTTAESIWHWRRGNFSETGVWPWYILRTDHSALTSAVLTPVLDGTGLFVLLSARLAASLLTPICYLGGLNAGVPLLVLILSQFLLTIRCRLGGEGGDQMTTIMLMMAFLPQVIPGEQVATMAALLVGAQISLSYLASGSAKLFGPLWRRGEALAEIMAHFQFGNYWLMSVLRTYPAACRVICLSVIAFQISFLLFFLLPAPYAYIYLLGGVAFHVGIAYFMRLYLFVLTFLGTYPCLIYSREVFRAGPGYNRLTCSRAGRRARPHETKSVRLNLLRTTAICARACRDALMRFSALKVTAMAFVDQEDALKRLFTSRSLPDDCFSVNMRDQDMPAVVARAIDRVRKQYGSLDKIWREPDYYVVKLERAEIPVQIALDPQSRITGLLLRPATPTTGSLGSFVETIAALPGKTACLISTDGVVLHGHNTELPLAVGSAMKLAVLQAVAAAVAEGRLQWDQVCALQDEDRSLPSGILQDWPPGARLTLESVAALMISISDNTATDFLLRLAGRAAVETFAPSCKPFLTTREACILKAAAHGDLRAKWLGGDTEARRTQLADIATLAPPSVQDIAPGNAPEIEWFLSATQLAGYLAATRHLAAFRIHSGPADDRHWRQVAYKGGSEANVLNLSIALSADDGREHCVVATWNAEEEINPERLMTPFLGIIYALRQCQAPLDASKS